MHREINVDLALFVRRAKLAEDYLFRTWHHLIFERILREKRLEVRFSARGQSDEHDLSAFVFVCDLIEQLDLFAAVWTVNEPQVAILVPSIVSAAKLGCDLDAVGGGVFV